MESTGSCSNENFIFLSTGITYLVPVERNKEFERILIEHLDGGIK
jgi:hypothetical protein